MAAKDLSGRSSMQWKRRFGWGVFALGWVIWLVAICLPGWNFWPSPRGNGDLTFPIAIWLLLMPLSIGDAFWWRAEWGLALWRVTCTFPYLVAVFASALGSFRRWRGFRLTSRLLALGLLEAWLYTAGIRVVLGKKFNWTLPTPWLYVSDMQAAPGFVVLAAASASLHLNYRV